MTFDEEQDLKALETIQLLSPAKRQTIALAFNTFGVDAEKFLLKESVLKYIQFEDFTISDLAQKKVLTFEEIQKLQKISITSSGKIYLNWLQSQKEKEGIDLKIKKLAITNSKFQKWTPVVSAVIAILSIVMTSIIALSKKDKLYIPVQEVQRLQQTQEQINKSIATFLDSLSVHQK